MNHPFIRHRALDLPRIVFAALVASGDQGRVILLTTPKNLNTPVHP